MLKAAGSLRLLTFADRAGVSDRDQVRRVPPDVGRGEGGDHSAGAYSDSGIVRVTFKLKPRVALRDVCATRPIQARKFAKAMKAPLIFCSAAESINVQKIFKIVLSKAFDLKCTIPMQTETGAPILEY